MPFVLHVDVDACFAQVEQLRDPSLKGKAVAVQQHQDIIAVDALAKAAGVVKHMAPAEARRLLASVGGRVVHVSTAEGGRISYQPYREASARLLRLLRALPWAAVVEKASIDEAYVLLGGGASAEPSAAAAAAAALAEEGEGDGEEAGWAAQAALQRAQEVKAAVFNELGLTVSVGAAPNRLMAKLASAAAKPDGVRLLADQRASLALLAQTPARRLPGYGGKAAEAFEQHGISVATDLQRFTQQQLEEMLACKPAAAAQLALWCRGVDDSPVQDRGPPKSLSVQMSLTPQLLPMHPSQGLTMAVAGGRAGVLEPLVTGRPDFRRRVRQLMAAMGGDLLQRVQEDRAEEGRWPRTLSASMRAFGAGRDQSFTTRSTSFPALGLQQARQAQQPTQASREQQQQHQAQPARQQAAAMGGERQLGPLEEAVVSSLESLIHQVAAGYPPTATVVELRLAATNFQSAASAAAAAPISRYFAAAPRGGASAADGEAAQQRQRPQQQQREGKEQQQVKEQPLQQQVQQQPVEPEQQQEQEQVQALPGAGQLRQPAQPAANYQQQQAPHPDTQQQVVSSGCAATAKDTVDLGGIDLREQQRIMQQIELERRAQQAQRQQRNGAAGKPTVGGGNKRGAGKAPPGPDPKQRSIAAFLRK